MISLLCSFAVLLLGYWAYGRVTEHVFAPDSRKTPAIVREDGVDFMPITMHTAEACSWSMQKYKSSLKHEMTGDEEAKAEWDELEKSIVANIADEIKIAITGNGVEMTVFKKIND